MKKISKFVFMCLMGIMLVSVVSCNKVNKDDLDKKIQNAMISDKEPEFTDEEYQFMAEYLYDNCDEIQKMDVTDENFQMTVAYMGILSMADYEGKLSPKAKEAYSKFTEKMTGSEEYKNYKQTEAAIIEELQNADIDWDQAFEEVTEVSEEVVTEVADDNIAVEE